MKYLYSVVEEAPCQTDVVEYESTDHVGYIFREILRGEYNIVYFHCNMMNVDKVAEVAEMVKKAVPTSIMVMGGTEVSFGTREFMEQHPAKFQGIYYGDTYSAKTETKISSPPRITGFVCYRNIPCHQSCFYAADLCRQKPYEPKYKIRADYEHFLWCYYRAKAPMQYLGLTVSSYEGGGYSETKENLKRSAAEHKEITAKYMNPGELFRYRAVMALTLAPLRTALAESKHFSAMYQKLMSKAYGRKQEK